MTPNKTNPSDVVVSEMERTDIREAFEAKFLNLHYILDKNPDTGEYKSQPTFQAYVGWQECWNHKPAIVYDEENLAVPSMQDTVDSKPHNSVWGVQNGCYHCLENMADDWQDVSTAPKDGTRIRLLDSIEYDGWYEENLSSFIGMDSEWNLIKLNPTRWKPLPLPPKELK